MLVPNQIIDVTLSNKNIQHFRNLGYTESVREKIMVRPEDLPSGSHLKLKVICDGCGNEFEREKREYDKRHSDGKDFCVHCAFSNKTKFTNLEKYGCENACRNEKIQEKIKATNLQRYGCENPFSNDDIKEKTKETMVNRYGVEYAMQSKEIMAKAKETFYKNNSISTSIQQKKIYGILMKSYPYNDICINYPYGRCSLDIALFIDNEKINIEYDGWYWHQDQQRDRRRDEFLKSNGWKILRIKGSHKIPTEVQLNEALNKLIYKDYHYTEIVLSDWEKLNVDKEGDVAL